MVLAIGFTISLLIAFVAYKRNSLSLSGFVAAIILGTLLYFSGSFIGFSTMLIFFLSSSVISKVNKINNKKKNIVDKGPSRDYIQVLANGSVALIFATLYTFLENDIFLTGVIMAFASANADTWASEIGQNSKQQPVYLLKRVPVKKGLSGGVTNLGFIASAFGAALIAFWYVLLLGLKTGFTMHHFWLFAFITGAGFSGSIIDSILGELFQVKYTSWKDETIITELAIEDFKENKIASGLKWLDNNVVNFLSSLISSLFGIWLVFIF